MGFVDFGVRGGYLDYRCSGPGHLFLGGCVTAVT